MEEPSRGSSSNVSLVVQGERDNTSEEGNQRHRYISSHEYDFLQSLVLEYRDERFKLRRYHETLKLLSSHQIVGFGSSRSLSSSNSKTTTSPTKSSHRSGYLTEGWCNEEMCRSEVEVDGSLLDDLPKKPEPDLGDGETRTTLLSAKPNPTNNHLWQLTIDENTPKNHLLNRKNLAKFSPEEYNYRWRCEICGVEGLRSREYWSHCLEDEHRQRAAYLGVSNCTGADIDAQDKQDVAISMKRGVFASPQEKEVERMNSEDTDPSTELGSTTTIESDNNDPFFEWHPPPTNSHTFWNSSIRSMVEQGEAPKNRIRRCHSADLCETMIDIVSTVDGKGQHIRRRSCPDLFTPEKGDNEEKSLSLGSPSFNLSVAGDLSIANDEIEDAIALLAKLSFI